MKILGRSRGKGSKEISAKSGMRLLQRAHQPVEEGLAVGAAEEWVAGVFGMRHQAENRAGLVEDAGDRASRAVEVCFFVTLAARSAIAEGDEATRFKPVERVRVCSVIAIVMRDRHPNSLAGFIAVGKDRLVVLDAQIDLAASEAQRAVR